MTWIVYALLALATDFLLRRYAPRMHWLFRLLAAFGVAFIFAFVIGFVQGFTGSYARSYDENFKVSYVRSATESCTRMMVSKGAPEAKAKPVCACYAQYLVDHHGSSELTRYSLSMSSPDAQKAFTEAVDACRGQAH